MRFAAAVTNDIRLQVRYGLYGVSLLMVLVWGLLLGALNRVGTLSFDVLVPPFVAVNLMITTFYFMAGLVLFEKSEGVLPALVTTPLRSAEYLLSKALTLAVLGAAETLLIVAFTFGPRALSVRLCVAAILLGLIYAWAGFVTVVPFESINGFLMPSVPICMLLLIPLLAHFDLISDAAVAWHPAQPMMVMLREPNVVAGFVAAAWCVLALFAARRQFLRFVVRA